MSDEVYVKAYESNSHTDAFDMSVKVDVSRLSKHLDEAQTYLEHQVIADTSRFVPFNGGNLRGSVYSGVSANGDHYVAWNTPYAHYQYEGVLYVNPKHNASCFIDAKGDLHGFKGPRVPTGRHLTYHAEGTGDHWFTSAKRLYGEEWVRATKKIAR